MASLTCVFYTNNIMIHASFQVKFFSYFIQSITTESYKSEFKEVSSPQQYVTRCIKQPFTTESENYTIDPGQVTKKWWRKKEEGGQTTAFEIIKASRLWAKTNTTAPLPASLLQQLRKSLFTTTKTDIKNKHQQWLLVFGLLTCCA